MKPSALALEQNLALMAGAGTGKTHGLITLCLHLLGGAREGREPLRPAQLCLVTFTEKAAGELRARLRSRLERLADAPFPADVEPDLAASFNRLGRECPPAPFWRDLLRQLGGAFVGTFHALALQLLRRAPLGTGELPGAFELLDEPSSHELLQDVAERVVLEALEEEDAGVVELCRELDFGGSDGRWGVTPQLVQVFARTREDGILPESLAIGDLASVQEGFEAALQEARAALGESVALDAARDGSLGELLAEAGRALEGMGWENFTEPHRFPALHRVLSGSKRLSAQKKELGEALKCLRNVALGKNDVVGLASYYAAGVVIPQEQAFKSLLTRMRTRHREALERTGSLDFAELMLRARDLLRDHSAVRRDVQARFKALLVDEFQDTNVLQLELVTLMAEKRDGAPRKLGAFEGGEVSALPLETGMLCVVGDRKQSIYEFRGADVSVFGRMADKLEAEGGVRAFLQDNRRSSPALLEFFNGVFTQCMAPTPQPRDFEVAYVPAADDLRPVRKAVGSGSCVDRLTFDAQGLSADACREEEAELLARRLAQLLAPDGPGAQPGDIAILFHRFTQVDTYRRALLRHRIPHRVVRGRGFYGAQEVLDLASLLALLADPADRIALAGVLRSPWVGVTDETLLRLSLEKGGRLAMETLESAPGGEGALLRRFLAWFRPLEAERDRLPIPRLLVLALEESGYRLALAASPSGAQALANVDKLVALAERWSQRARGDLQRFASHLLGLAEADPREAEAESADLVDRACVQLLTIHQAKGLEWPIVCVPDLAARPKAPPTDAVLYDRRLGLAVRPRLEGAFADAGSARVATMAAEWKRREGAESVRKLYVALTRARDGLVLSGNASGPGNGTWRAKLDEICDAPAFRSHVQNLSPELLPEPPVAEPLIEAPRPEEAKAARAILARVRAPRGEGVTAGHQVLRVEVLEDFARCPRRFALSHRAGLVEVPAALESAEDLELLAEDVVPGVDWGEGRALLHRALERLDFTGPEAQLDGLLAGLGVLPGSPWWENLQTRCRKLLASEFARSVAASAVSPLRAEDYCVRLNERLSLRGRLDLLYQDGAHGFRAVELCAAAHPGNPRGLEAYSVVLRANALAAQGLLPAGVAVTSGIVFLDDATPEFHAERGRPAGQPLEMIGAELFRARAGLLLPGRPAAECAALACGYQSHCHAARGGV